MAFQVSNGGRARGGEHAATLQLPVLRLLQQVRPTRRIEASLEKMPSTRVRRCMEELAERTSRCDVDPLQQVGAPDLASVGPGEVA